MSGLAGPFSISEIEFHATRAVAAAGAPFGVAAATGRALGLLAAQDRLHWDRVTAALTALAEGKTAASMRESVALSALAAGPLMAIASGGMLVGRDIDDPGLARLIASALSEEGAVLPPVGGIRIPEADWQVIEAWFSRYLVPSSEASRLSGAGAGLVDTD